MREDGFDDGIEEGTEDKLDPIVHIDEAEDQK
jgi:hypothetical protein